MRDTSGAAPLPMPPAILLAGGRGSRLYELTARICKPAVPFVRGRRIVDFTMENICRSGIGRVIVASQYRAATLEAHLAAAWRGRLGDGLRLSRAPDGAAGYGGTADAVWKNAAAIDAMGADEVLILSADHVYAMDYRPLVAAHRASGAMVTIAAKVVARDEASAFGVIDAAADGKIRGFVEKPAEPPAMAGDPAHALVSMGIYVCDWRWLRARLAADALDPASSHDFGHDLIPAAVAEGMARAYCWQSDGGRVAFWRDVGTLDALRETGLAFETGQAPCPLPFPQIDPRGLPGPDLFRLAAAVGGMRLYAPPRDLGGFARPVLVDETLVMAGACLAPGCRLTRAILGPGAVLPPGLVVGEDPREDGRWFRVTPGGTVLVTAEMLARRSALRMAPMRVALPAPAAPLRLQAG